MTIKATTAEQHYEKYNEKNIHVCLHCDETTPVPR
jgi:hypothetical protein